MMPRPLENRIQPIKLSESATKRLADRIREMIEEAEEFHSDWEDLHEEYMNMYLCVPKSEVKTYPWPNSSNLFLPLTRVITDGILAQEHDAMFANDPTVKVASIAGHGLDSSEALSQFYGEYVYKNVIPLKTIAADHMFDNTVDGTAVMRPRWSRDRRLERTMSVSYEPRTRRIETELMGVKAIAEVPDEPQAVSIEEVREVSEERPYVDCCDLSRIMVAPDTHGSMQWPYCRWYYQESELTWEDLQARRRVGYDGIDDELRAAMSNRDIGDVERAELAAQGLTESQATKTAKVLEIYMRWPLPTSYSDRNGKTVEQAEDAEDAYHEEIAVTYLVDTHKISRIVPLSRISPSGNRPHILNRYSRLPRFFYGLGIPAKMRHLQAMMNSSFNQMMDYGTLQNIPFYFYEPATTGLMPDIAGIRPGSGIPVLNARGINIPRLQGDTQFWQSVGQIGQAWAERDGNINDYNLGRAPSTPNAPRTARGQSMMLQQNNIGFGRLISMHSEPFVEMFRAVDSLYVQNAPEELVYKVTDKASGRFSNGRITRRDLQQEKEFQFILSPNRQAEQQLNQQIFQIMTAIPMIQQNPMAVRELARQMYEGLGKQNFQKIWPADQPYQLQPGQPPPGVEQGAPSSPDGAPFEQMMPTNGGGYGAPPMGMEQGIMPPDLSGLMQGPPQMGFGEEGEEPAILVPDEEDLNVEFTQQ